MADRSRPQGQTCYVLVSAETASPYRKIGLATATGEEQVLKRESHCVEAGISCDTWVKRGQDSTGLFSWLANVSLKATLMEKFSTEQPMGLRDPHGSCESLETLTVLLQCCLQPPEHFVLPIVGWCCLQFVEHLSSLS
ncbi:hypothetical protein RRG08_019994 [Elysia crispata]|uniref:Uncharacterized protein n=1 Tax=Elysia crispata TaxID=231223 RepID=A0AAE1BB65_9GAST|nr:hypothetical protein RRG08_019994 [Elysia crispata]